MILICYDGSQDARAAIERASGFFRGQPAVVLSVWEDFSRVLLRTGAALGGAAIDFEEIDQASEASARERAEEVARLAREAGFDAQPRVAVRGVTIWETKPSFGRTWLEAAPARVAQSRQLHVGV